MKTLLLSLLTACATASAQPAPTPPPPPPPSTGSSCAVKGDPLLVIDHKVVANVKKDTTTTKVYASGAWTFEERDSDGKVLKTNTGCLAKADLAKVTALDGAPWKVTHPRMHCMAMAQEYTVFTVGAHSFTQKICGDDTLDDKTAAALADAEKAVEAQATAPAQQNPPCCKK
jgi:hypothetical protein